MPETLLSTSDPPDAGLPCPAIYSLGWTFSQLSRLFLSDPIPSHPLQAILARRHRTSKNLCILKEGLPQTLDFINRFDEFHPGNLAASN